MLDDELREQLADWVRPVTTLPIPDIRVRGGGPGGAGCAGPRRPPWSRR
jgi:hypothetical protein